MSEDRALINEGLLAVIRAKDSTLYVRVIEEMKYYNLLISFGWSHEQILTAAELGYKTDSHTIPPSRPFFTNFVMYSKYGCGPGWLEGWLRHHYRRLRGAKLEMTLEEFVALWRELVKQPYYVEGRRLWPSEAMTLYMRARLGGIKHEEAQRLLLIYAGEHWAYVQLRSRLSAATVQRIVSASIYSDRPGMLRPKDVMQALKYGASVDEVVESASEGNTGELAQHMRTAR